MTFKGYFNQLKPYQSDLFTLYKITPELTPKLTLNLTPNLILFFK